jgi:CRP/FNR family transcriptional regulator
VNELDSLLHEIQGTLQHHEPGTVLFRERDDPDGLYVIESGEVDLCFASRHGIGKVLRIAEKGQVLGLSELVLNHPYECTATSRTSCVIRFIPRALFLRALERSPALWFNVLTILSHHVGIVYDDMRALAA